MNGRINLKLNTVNMVSMRSILVLSVIYICALMLDKTGIVSRTSSLLIIFPILISLLNWWKYLSELNTNNVLYSIILLFGTLSLVFSGQQYFYVKMIRLLSFLSIPATVLFQERICPTKKTKKNIYMAYVILALVYVILSFTEYSHIAHGEWGQYRSHTLTLGFDNSNETGMCLLLCIFALGSAFFFYKKRGIKILLFLVTCYLVYLLFETESRTCIIVLVAVFVCWYFDRNKSPKKSKILFLMLVPVVYLFIVSASLEIAKNWSVMGEGISTGREYIYMDSFKMLNGMSFLIGDFQTFFFQNLHNGYLSIFMTAGVFCFTAFMALLYRLFYKLRKSAKTHSETLAWWGLMGIILHSSAEAAFLTSGVMFASFMGTLCILSKHEREEG